MKKVVGVVLTAALVLGSLVAAMPANAAASAGASVSCELTGPHCVSGSGQSENAGSSTTGGFATAVCHGDSNGAVLMEVTCSVAGYSSTKSLPGPVGAAYVRAPATGFQRQQVCWTVTGYFPQVLGGVNEVTTSGCSIVTL